jgi:GTP-sensing pleiotropic transcriptional regulator CodY
MTDKVEPIIEEGWIISNKNKIFGNEICQSKSKAEVMCDLMNRQFPEMVYEILKVRRTIEIIKEGE